eukprot:7261528-Prymnesium_polylepis.2
MVTVERGTVAAAARGAVDASVTAVCECTGSVPAACGAVDASALRYTAGRLHRQHGQAHHEGSRHVPRPDLEGHEAEQDQRDRPQSLTIPQPRRLLASQRPRADVRAE